MSAPIYKLVVSSIGGEKRFAAAVARRLQSLGALTRADRRAASGLDLSESNFDSPLGRKSLKCGACHSQLYCRSRPESHDHRWHVSRSPQCSPGRFCGIFHAQCSPWTMIPMIPHGTALDNISQTFDLRKVVLPVAVVGGWCTQQGCLFASFLWLQHLFAFHLSYFSPLYCYFEDRAKPV